MSQDCTARLDQVVNMVVAARELQQELWEIAKWCPPKAMFANLPEVPDEFTARLIFDALNYVYAGMKGYNGTDIQWHPLASIWNDVPGGRVSENVLRKWWSSFAESFNEVPLDSDCLLFGIAFANYCSSVLGITPNNRVIHLVWSSIHDKKPPKGVPLSTSSFYAPRLDNAAITPNLSLGMDYWTLYLDAHTLLSIGWYPSGADDFLAQSKDWYLSNLGLGSLDPRSKEFPKRALLHEQMINLRNHVDRTIQQIADGERRAQQYGKNLAPDLYGNAPIDRLLATTFVVRYHFDGKTKSKLTLQKAFDLARQAVYGQSKKPQRVAAVLKDLKQRNPPDEATQQRNKFWLEVLSEKHAKNVRDRRNPEPSISGRRRTPRVG